MENVLTEKNSLKWNSNTLKLFAITAMLIDHIAWAFVPTVSPLGELMHLIGRITAPTMCFFIAEGYYHTRNVKRYALRLAVFAAISYLPFFLFEEGKLPNLQNFIQLNVIYTLLCGLLALWAWDKIENRLLRFAAVFGLCILSMPGDWSFFGVLYVLGFGIYHGDFRRQMKWFTAVSLVMAGIASLPYLIMNIGLLVPSAAPMILQQLKGRSVPPVYSQFFQFGVFLAVPLLMCYSGERGGGKYGKWVFYIFYPLHLTILALLKWLIIK